MPMDSDAIAEWIEQNGYPETVWIDGPEHTRGSWWYECKILVADGVHRDNDKLYISRSHDDGSEFGKTRFEFHFPPRHSFEGWEFGPSREDNPANTGELRRYADILAAAEPLVDFDAAWVERTDITEQRRAHLREAIDRDWTLIQDPVDQEYTAAYREAKRSFTQFARTPDQLRAWLEATAPEIGIDLGAGLRDPNAGSLDVVTLAFPDGAVPESGPQPEAHPHWSGVDAAEGQEPGWSR